MRPPRWSVVALVAACIAACAQPTSAPQDGDPAPAADAETPPAAEEGPPASTSDEVEDAGRDLLDFTGRTLDGDAFDGSSLAGDVLVWFWAPW